MANAEEVVSAFESLAAEEKAKAFAEISVRALPELPDKWVGPIWLLVVGAFVALLLGGAVLMFILVLDDKDTEVIGALVTGALGVLAGLLAPSPVQPKGSK
jgi:hypothetical protein